MKGLHYVSKRASGRPIRWYVYAWRGGPVIAKREGGPKPVLDTNELRAALTAREDLARPDPATLLSLIRDWRHSPDWKRLAPSTRTTWGLALDAIEDRWHATPLSVWNDPRMVGKVMDWRDSRAGTPRAADIGVTVLSRLLEFGRLRARLTINVAAGVPCLYRGADRAEIVWTHDDLDSFSVAALALNRPHVIDGLWLGALTGMRRADLVGVTFQEVGASAIIRVAQKRSRGRRRRATIPILPETQRLIEELRTDRYRQPGVDTLLVNSKGLPWTAASFTQAFNAIRDAAHDGSGIMHKGDASLGEADRSKHLHDLRGTFVTRLCRAGLTDREIADVVAWSPESVARVRRVYVDDAAVVVALAERLNRAGM